MILLKLFKKHSDLRKQWGCSYKDDTWYIPQDFQDRSEIQANSADDTTSVTAIFCISLNEKDICDKNNT